MRSRMTVVLSVAAAAVLAGCSSGATPAASSTTSAAVASSAPSSTTSSMASSAASSSDDETITAGTTVSPTGSATTVGQGVTTLDEQSAAWFTTFCGSVSEIGLLQQKTQADSPAEAGQALQQFGQQITAAAQQMGQQPPPTFEGGPELSATAQQAFTQLGTSFSDFGTKLATLDPNDKAGAQQLASEFEAQMGQLQQLQNIQPDPAVLQAAVKQVPECAALEQMSGSGSSAAPSSPTG